MVSVIITTYNRPVERVKNAIYSVIRQTYKDWELLVINDFPQDKKLSDEIACMIEEIHDSRIRYIVNDVNRGANYSRNRGVSEAKGEFVAFLDDDDEWLSEKLEKQISQFTKPEIGIVCCKFYVKRQGSEDKILPKKIVLDNCFERILVGNFIGPTSMPLIRKKYISQIGGFDEKMKSCQEYDLWIRLIKISEVRCVEEPLVNYYISTDSTYKTSNKYNEGIYRILDKYSEDYIKYPKAMQLRCLDMAYNMLRDKEFVHYIKYKCKAIKSRPFSCDNLLFIWFLKYKILRM